jgi:FkbM family methyltransferase
LDVFSQCDQDLFVLEVLDGKTDGYFLDSGASDGIRASNTYLLETKFQWKGICVEPNSAYFAALVKNRGCICVNSCLYDRAGTVEFVESAEQLGGIVDEYDPAHWRYVESVFDVDLGEDGQPVTTTKSARTVRSVLQEAGAPPTIDYWSLDTEGSELAILKSFPFDEYSLRVLTIEHNWLPAREHIRVFLAGMGYQRIKALHVDDCYVWTELVTLPSWRTRTRVPSSRSH